ncbi:clostripain-related cysteine peptidase [Tunturiibacter lichenicola]|uniref:clostripain-related cysteine peptidase n=1 Tax=Tunturiibacter lichenicola TaxID=2051959 RepID=UPI003D9B4B0F
MGKLYRIIVHIFIFFVALTIKSTALGGHQPTAMPPNVVPWTILIFMNGDNNLEPDALMNFGQLAKIGGNADVNVVVQLDRIAKYAHTQPDWAQTLRFRVTKGMKPLPSNAMEDIGEANMGDPKVLSDFVTWGQSHFPAQHYMLIIWDHGQGWRLFLNTLLTKERSMRHSRAYAPTDNAVSQRSATTALRSGVGKADSQGITAPLNSAPGATFRSASNDETNNDQLYDSEIESGLKSALNGKKIDVIGFDACLMSMLEVGYALRDVGSYMVGSEELEPGDGWKYDDWLSAIETHLPQDGAELAKMTVASYEATYQNPTAETTLSALDLSKIPAVASSVSALADSLMTNIVPNLQAIITARNETSTYAPGYQFYHVDIVEFLTNLRAQVTDAKLLAVISETESSVRSSIIANYAGTARQGSYGSFGLAIYFPATSTDHTNDPFAEGGYEKNNTYYPVDFVQDYHWSDFLHQYWSKVP